MKFKTLTLDGIKSFKSLQEINLDRPPGLYFMFGRNEVSPSLGSNAAGKSTIWDGLCWSLYGKTVRGLRAGEVRSWGRKQPSVASIVFEGDDGTEHIVRRHQTPNKLFLDDVEIEQSAIVDVFPLPFEPFLYSVVFGQKNTKFLDLKAGDALKLFTEVLQLDVWLERSSNASNVLKGVESDSREYLRLLSNAEGRAEEMVRQLEVFNEESTVWAREQADAEKRKRNEVKRLKKKVGKLAIKRELMAEHLDVAKAELSVLNEEVQQLLADVQNRNHLLESVERRIARATGELKFAREQVTEINRFINAGKMNKCGVCLQPISKERHKSRIRKLREGVRMKMKPVTKLVNSRIKRLDRIEALEKKANTKRREVNVKRDEIGDLQTDLRVIVREIEDYQDDIDTLQEKVPKQNPYVKRIMAVKSEMADIAKAIALHRRNLDYANKSKEYSKYWVKGFREIRLFLVAEFLTQFEIEANNCLSQLGMADWSLSFDVETETKSKTISKGFTTFVKSPNSANRVAWESWSGGEAQRLLLAGSIGLSNMILGKFGVSSNIEVWDEPSNWLSEDGIDDLLDTLRAHALTSGKQVWVVDQRFLEYGNFDGMVTVVKGKKGSRIETP